MVDVFEQRFLRMAIGAAITILVPTAGIFSFASAKETSFFNGGVGVVESAPVAAMSPKTEGSAADRLRSIDPDSVDVKGILKDMDIEIGRISRRWGIARAGAPISAADAIADGDELLAVLDRGRRATASAVERGDSRAFLIALESMTSKYDDIGGMIGRISATRNPWRYLANAPRELEDSEESIGSLEEAGQDASRPAAILAEAKSLLGSIGGMEPGSATWRDAVLQLAQSRQEFLESTGSAETVDGLSDMIGSL